MATERQKWMVVTYGAGQWRFSDNEKMTLGHQGGCLAGLFEAKVLQETQDQGIQARGLPNELHSRS